MGAYIDIPSAMNQPEGLAYYSSEHINGSAWRYKTIAYSLNEADMKNIFEDLLLQVERDCEDGRIFRTDYKVFIIEAVHHYQSHEVQSGQEYMGFYETYEEIDVDYLEVVYVGDEDGKDYPQWASRLNNYNKKKIF